MIPLGLTVAYSTPIFTRRKVANHSRFLDLINDKLKTDTILIQM
jgi:hypothetical protein